VSSRDRAAARHYVAYSEASATMGSTFVALIAGMAEAPTPVTTSNIVNAMTSLGMRDSYRVA